MNPVANVPVFLSLTQGATDAERRRIAVTTLLAVSVGCVVSAVAGEAILSMPSASASATTCLAGGLLVLLIALSMLHGTASTQQAPTDRAPGPGAQRQRRRGPSTAGHPSAAGPMGAPSPR